VKGVSTIPIRHPNTELKTAAASFPPTALVRMTADDSGGGMQPTVINLTKYKMKDPVAYGMKHQQRPKCNNLQHILYSTEVFINLLFVNKYVVMPSTELWFLKYLK
jgi:hypothetical protein